MAKKTKKESKSKGPSIISTMQNHPEKLTDQQKEEIRNISKNK